MLTIFLISTLYYAYTTCLNQWNLSSRSRPKQKGQLIHSKNLQAVGIQHSVLFLKMQSCVKMSLALSAQVDYGVSFISKKLAFITAIFLNIRFLNNARMQRQSIQKHLGLFLDKKFSFLEHIDVKNLPAIIITAFVLANSLCCSRPHLDYGDVT